MRLRLGIIDRYIFSRLLENFFLISFVLLMMVWLASSLQYIDFIARKGLNIGFFIKFNSLLLIHIFNTSMPICAMLAAVIIFQNLAHDKELIVLKCSGFSNNYIIRPFLLFAGGVFFINLLTSLYLMPRANFEFKNLREEVKSDFFGMLIEDGVFNKQMNNKILYVAQSNDKEVRGIFLFDKQDGKKQISVVARGGEYANSPSGPKFILNNGSFQEYDRSKQRIGVSLFDSYIINLAENKVKEERKWRKPDDLTILELFSLYRADPIKYSRLYSEIHARFIGPLYTVILPMLSIIMLLRLPYNRRAGLARPVVAVAFSSLVFLLSIYLQNEANANSNDIRYMYLFPGCLIILGWYGLNFAKTMGRFKIVS